MSAIELDDVAFRYEDMAMRFTLTVPTGVFLVAFGPSGAGKSTLLNLIAGFDRPISGTIRLLERDMKGIPPAERPVTMLFQDHNLFAHLDVAANVGLGIDPGLRLKAADRDRVRAALAEVGLERFEHRLPAQLSGGERQRIALARCLVRDQPILLLDEPFAALGPRMRGDMLDMVERLRRDHALTVVMVTHQPADARRCASLAAFVLAGQIRHVAPPDVLFGIKDDPDLDAYLGEVEAS
ncbi:MAG: thiamine ABC transporter ATP-binding protein [Dongiaceae bacterium]